MACARAYVVDANNQDNKPLLKPVVIPRSYSTPAISIISPKNNTRVGGKVDLFFNLNNYTSWISYSLDGQANVATTGNITLTNLSDGLHNVTVYAESTFGLGVSDSAQFTVDTLPPSILIMSPENKTYDTNEIPLSFTLNEAVSQISFAIDGQENVTISGNTTLTELSNGEHSVTVFAMDELGNTGASETVNFTIARESAPFPITPLAAASAASIAFVGVGLIIYFKKRKD